ncbi:MAG: extracellular solute-binding protein [Clostridia bacterium]|nr:extracellular solute-binding protein [Clostridia bacterium]
MKRILCAILCLCMLIAIPTGCTKDKKEDPNEQVTLKWLIGGPGELDDCDEVWARFNEELQKYIPNTTIEFTVIPHADYAEKWRLMSAAQEPMDIVWVSYALNFVDEVGKGSYMDMTALIEEYGQEMKSELPEWLLDLTTIDGKIYAVPNYQMMAMPVGFSVDKAHVDKGWIDADKASEMFMSDKVLHKEDYKIFEDYFDKVLSSGEKVKYVSSQFLNRGIKSMIGMPADGIETIIAKASIINGDDG